MADCIDCSYCAMGSSYGIRSTWICTRGGSRKKLTGGEEACSHFTEEELHNCFECVHAKPLKDLFAKKDKEYLCMKTKKRINQHDYACSNFVEDDY